MTYRPPSWFLLLGVAAFLLTSCGRNVDGQIWAYRTHRPFLPGESQMYGPILVGDKAIVCGGYGWDREGRLAALDVETGRSRWEHVVGWCVAPPVVVGNVAVGIGTQPDTLMIKAADIDTGKLRWERTARKQFGWHRPLVR